MVTSMNNTEIFLRYLDLVIDHLIHNKYIKINGLLTIVFDEDKIIQRTTGEKVLLDPDGNEVGVVDSEAVSEVFLLMDTFKYDWFDEETIGLIINKLQQKRSYYIYRGSDMLYEKYPWCKMEWMTRA